MEPAPNRAATSIKMASSTAYPSASPQASSTARGAAVSPANGCMIPARFGKEQVDDRPGHQLGDPASPGGGVVQGPVVEALDQLGGAVEQEGAEQAGHEVGPEVGHVGVHEGDEVALAGFESDPHGLALAAEPGARSRWIRIGCPAVRCRHALGRWLVYDDGPGSPSHLRRPVDGAVVDDQHLVEQGGAAADGGQSRGDRADDRPHGGCLVPGRDADGDLAVAFGCHQLLEVERAVPEYPPGALWFVAPRLRHGAIIAHGGHVAENRGIGPVRSPLNRQCGALWGPVQGRLEGLVQGRLEGPVQGRLEGWIRRSGGPMRAG